MQPTGTSRNGKGFLPAVFLGTLAVGLGMYITQLVIVANKPCQHRDVQDLNRQKDVAARYDDTADNFDSEVGTSEALMGINSIRKRLSRQCKGDVLEVSCGTGRNLGYYDLSHSSAVDSLTFNDLSKQMVDVCKKKWNTLYPNAKASHFKPGLSVRFATGSALNAMPLAPTGKKYTTIIQTMGLCSTPSPHELLHNMAQHLDLSNPDSRILLLEHGRSEQHGWLNNILDNAAEKHAEIHGCWFNRDIGGIVESAAAQSGLEVVAQRRKHFGTTCVFELKPSDKTAAAAAKAASVGPAAATEKATDSSQSTGWRSWLGLN